MMDFSVVFLVFILLELYCVSCTYGLIISIKFRKKILKEIMEFAKRSLPQGNYLTLSAVIPKYVWGALRSKMGRGAACP